MPLGSPKASIRFNNNWLAAVEPAQACVSVPGPIPDQQPQATGLFASSTNSTLPLQLIDSAKKQ